MLSAVNELERFLDRRTVVFAKAMIALADTHKAPWSDADHHEALRDLAKLIQRTMILADLHGRKRVLMESDAIRNRATFEVRDATPIAPSMTFHEAVDDLVSRDTRLAAGYRDVQQLYNEERAFALAKSADRVLTERIQKAIAELMRTGRGGAPEEIASIAAEHAHDFSKAYATNVYRTNVSTAYTAGRFKQALDDEVQDVAPAFEYVGVADAAQRPNHGAAVGLIAPTHHSVWDRYAPPLGYQCRCGIRLVSTFELQRRRLIDQNGFVGVHYPPSIGRAGPDDGFGHSPLRRHYLHRALGE